MSMNNHRYRPNAKFETASRKVASRIKTRDAILGNEEGLPDDPDRPGYHFARFAASADVNNNATFGPVFGVQANPGAGYAPVTGRRVRIKLSEEDGEWVVDKANFQDLIQAGIDPRGLNPNDPYRAFRYLDELVDLSSRGIGDGLIVQVQGWKYYTANYAYKQDIGTDATTHLDLTTSLPNVEDTHRYSVVAFNITKHLDSDPPWEVYDGTAIAITTALGEADIQTAFDLFPTDERIVPIMAYYLEYGQTEIKGPAYNVDLRTAWNLFGVIDGEVTLPKLANDVLHIATVAPAVTDDSGDGYAVGSRWINTTTGAEYVAMDVTVGAAVWAETTSSGGGGGITALTGDVTAGPGSGSQATTLATVNSNVGSFTNASITVNAKGLITAASSGSASTTGYILIQDQKTSGTNGGTFTTGADQTRTLNTIVADTVSIGSLSSNRFTLPAGTYRIRIDCPAYKVGSHQAFLYNFTDSTVVARGASSYTLNTGFVQTVSTVVTRFTIAGSKAFEVRHRSGFTQANDGFGVAAGMGTEVYTTVEITKE